jgi:hypothetical protein
MASNNKRKYEGEEQRPSAVEEPNDEAMKDETTTSRRSNKRQKSEFVKPEPVETETVLEKSRLWATCFKPLKAQYSESIFWPWIRFEDRVRMSDASNKQLNAFMFVNRLKPGKFIQFPDTGDLKFCTFSLFCDDIGLLNYCGAKVFQKIPMVVQVLAAEGEGALTQEAEESEFRERGISYNELVTDVFTADFLQFVAWNAEFIPEVMLTDEERQKRMAGQENAVAPSTKLLMSITGVDEVEHRPDASIHEANRAAVVRAALEYFEKQQKAREEKLSLLQQPSEKQMQQD